MGASGSGRSGVRRRPRAAVRRPWLGTWLSARGGVLEPQASVAEAVSSLTIADAFTAAGEGPAPPPSAPSRRFICSFPDCSANYNKAWKLDAHLCKHTGEVTGPPARPRRGVASGPGDSGWGGPPAGLCPRGPGAACGCTSLCETYAVSAAWITEANQLCLRLGRSRGEVDKF